jgi:phage repressor protein C with HTH and peptisase S24 domain
MNVKERIKKFIEHKGLPVSKFEEQCELSNGYISAMRKGFGADKLNNVLNVFPELNREWLLYGEGEMLKVPATVTMYNPTAEERQEVADGIDMSIYPAEVVEEIKAEVVEEIEAEIVVPIIPHEIALKTDVDIRKYIEDNASELEHFDPRTITAEVDSAERICTTSMSPAFMPSDRIFIKFLEEKSKITDGEIYYFDTRTRPTMIRMVKILEDGRLLLQALNPRYGDIYLRREDIINIGKIKGLYRDTFGDQYAEIEAVRRKKEEQIDKLLDQNQEALRIISNLIPKK